MLDTWHRLERVIKWTGLSVNSFALNIGLKRSENLYQIKRGNNGISRDLANLITTKYPTVSKGWLLTGEGDMFIESQPATVPEGGGVPYYGMDVLSAVESDLRSEPRFRINVPLFNDCDLAALNIGTAMQTEIPEAYLVVTQYFRGIRIIRFGEDPTDIQLLASNTKQYDPISIRSSEITKLFIVRGIIIKKSL